ncbi:MAG: RRXRR domain-containing protein [Herpetosiphonaceae bacterium]|nr:RRXRR domain-containing protein [Herpetosiphonaceae bacterium]
MPSLVFVRDERGVPLMPIAPAYARKLLSHGKAQRVPHHAFTIIQLNYTIANPSIGPIVLGMRTERWRTHLLGLSFSAARYRPLFYVQIDPFCLISHDHIFSTTALSSSLAEQTISTIRLLASLVPIEAIHLLRRSIYSGTLTRLMHSHGRFGLPHLERWRWQERLPLITQLQAFIDQPSIALGSFVMVPRYIDLRQPGQQPSIRRIRADVVLDRTNDILSLRVSTQIRTPYWSNEHVRWNMAPLSPRHSYQSIRGEHSFFVPIQPSKEDFDD